MDKESQEKLRTWWDDGDSKLKKSLYIKPELDFGSEIFLPFFKS